MKNKGEIKNGISKQLVIICNLIFNHDNFIYTVL